MAVYQSTTAVNLIAGEDLRNGEGLLLYIENDGGVGKVFATTLPTQVPVGVLAENPSDIIDTNGLGVPVVLLTSVVKMRAGGTITAGQLVVADTVQPGRVVGVAGITSIPAGGASTGVALVSAVDNDVFEVISQLIAN